MLPPVTRRFVRYDAGRVSFAARGVSRAFPPDGVAGAEGFQQERSRAYRLVTEREGTRLVVVCGFARGGPSASCAYPPFPVCRPAGAFTAVAFRRREDDEGESDENDGSALP
jgi:hypothetical protein